MGVFLKEVSANNLKNLSFDLPLKKIIAVTGPSGSGKTTLLRDLLYAEWKRRTTNDSNLLPQSIRGLPPVFYFGNQRAPRTKETVLDGLGGKTYLFELVQRVGSARCLKCMEAVSYEPINILYSRLAKLIGATIVVGIPLKVEILKESEHNLAARVIVSNQVQKVRDIESEYIIDGIPLALDSITVSELSKSRLLELLKHAQTLSPAKLFLLTNGELETVFLTPTCLVCGSEQRTVSGELFESEGLTAPEIASVILGRLTISDLVRRPLNEILTELNFLGDLGDLSGLDKEILQSFRRVISCACELALDYISLDRRLRTLSSGEFQRVKLAAVLVEQVYGSLVALDEPSSGLSPSDTLKLAKQLIETRNRGNSVLVATHSQELLEAADLVLEMPFAAKHSVSDYLKNKAQFRPPDTSAPVPTAFLNLSEVNLNNLHALNCAIPLSVLSCIYGVSGSGKSTLALQVLLPLVTKLTKERGGEAKLSFGKISAPDFDIGRIVFFRAAHFFSLRRAGVVSALRIVPAIRDLYLRTELARVRGLKAKDLNFYKPSPLSAEIRFKGILFSELGFLSVEEALLLFDKVPTIKSKLECAHDLGVGYLKLNQPLRELSAGEEQRLTLAAKVAVPGFTKTLFILDEPLNGLSHQEQVSVLVFLRKLITQGHTIVAIDHSQLMLDYSDWKIQLGPGAGKNGGKIVDTSTSKLI